MRPVVFLTDFGLTDDFAGVCHGVILQRCPGAQVVHLTHGIVPQDVLQGATVLRNTLQFMPVAVNLAVVDPGVGTRRRAIAVDCVDGRSFVGPDNGLLIPAIEQCGGIKHAVSIVNPDMVLSTVSATFHGRDVFAPAAAHLVSGGSIADLGTDIDPASLVRLELPVARRDGDALIGRVWNIDRFGNAAMHLTDADLQAAIGDLTSVELTVRTERVYATVARTYGNVRPGEILLYVDPYGCISIAVNRGDASNLLRLRTGMEVSIAPAPAYAEHGAGALLGAVSPQSR